MKWNTFFITLSLLLFCGLHPQCQDTQKYVYQDSALLYPETQEAEEYSEEETNETIFTDTSLVNNRLVLSADSVNAFKNARPFAYAKSLDSLLKARQEGKAQTYDNSPSFLDRFFSSELTKLLFWAIAALFIGFIVYKLFFTKGFFQGQATKSKITVLDEDEKEDAGTADYDCLAAQAAGNKNFRVAVRYLYLRALQKIAATGAIAMAADKTNAAYLLELSGKPYKNEFESLTLHYEYIWYGEFEIDEPAFKTLESRFKQLNTGYKQD